jgi:hypothetical protein
MSDSQFPKLFGLNWIELASFILACSVSFVLFLVRPRRDKKLPGPRGIPFLGNALQIPKVQPWVQFDKWTEQYGALSYSFARERTYNLYRREQGILFRSTSSGKK